MAKITQITVPLGARTVGVHGPFTSGTLPTSLTGYDIVFTNDGTWPASGDVMTVTVELSTDNGATWPSIDAQITYSGGAWKTKAGVTVNSTDWTVSLSNDSPTRKARITFNFLQACNLGATLSSV